MAVIEELGMTQSVDRWSIEVLLPVEAGKEGFVERPGVIKVFLAAFTSHTVKIGKGEGSHLAIRISAYLFIGLMGDKKCYENKVAIKREKSTRRQTVRCTKLNQNPS